MKRPRFRNPWPHEAHGILDILRWKLGLLPAQPANLSEATETAAPVISLSREAIAKIPDRGWRCTWLGHASMLLQGEGVSLLIDPIFSSHCAPLPLPSMKRFAALPCSIDDLPPIDAVLLTHSHYDHLDLPTLRQLGHGTPLFVAEGHADWLRSKGFTKVTEVAWHTTVKLSSEVTLTATAAQHFTARSPWDRDLAYWCGWLVEGAGCKLWHVGDSGYCPAFKELGQTHGPIDFAMIPIGAYQPRSIMQPMHMNPHEAVQSFLDADCKRACSIHWGTFQLTDEPLGEPPLRLKQALKEFDLSPSAFEAGSIGQSWQIDPS